MIRPFRFAVHLGRSPDGTGASWADQARRAEDLGYSALHLPDHLGDQLAPIPAMVAAAAATNTLRVGAMVFANDYRHPLLLAQEAATVDLLCGGRLELSLGAGWKRTDYEQAGLPFDPPAVRIDRFEEALTVVKGLLASEQPYSFTGSHYTITDYQPFPRPFQRPRPPLIVGGGGYRMLSIAGREADIVSIVVDMRAGTSDDVARDATPNRTRRKLAWVREAAVARFDEIELHTLVHFVAVTNDAEAAACALAPQFGVDPAEVTHVPLSLIGTLDEMEEELHWRRAEYGFSYYSIQSDHWDLLGPLVSRLTGT